MLKPKHLGKLLLQPEYRRHSSALKKLRNIPRYTPCSTDILGAELELVDSASFISMYNEIFRREIYKFKAKSQSPLIIDGGSNVGLSVLYFKQLYPDSHVIAFEPDAQVFKILKANVIKNKLSGVELVNSALWSSETILEFMSEGADGGRVSQVNANADKYQVQAVRLRNYLTKPVDFLKLDIEGAETEVIKDCQDLLYNVKNLFVEYHSFINKTQSLHIILNILFETGFRIHMHSQNSSSQPFCHRKIHLEMDMQVNIFAYRE